MVYALRLFIFQDAGGAPRFINNLIIVSVAGLKARSPGTPVSWLLINY
jgi:hypothetical protein